MRVMDTHTLNKKLEQENVYCHFTIPMKADQIRGNPCSSVEHIHADMMTSPLYISKKSKNVI